jgi:RHS repeat-associated protein
MAQTHRAAPWASTRETELITDTLITYAYDVSNRLIGVTTQITVTDGESTDHFNGTVRYRYDGLGRRTTSDGDNGVVRYLYTDRRVVEERDQTDALLATYAAGLMMDRGGSVSFYQTDGTGSVRALADDAGTVTERVDYDPFGRPVFEGGDDRSAFANPYFFRGSRYDTGVGLYVYGGLRYDPTTGRYLQRSGENLGNPYTYAGNNPILPRR